MAAHASRTRLNLSQRTGSLTLALDMTESIDAQTSAEQAPAHQLAAAHRGAMQLLAQLEDLGRDKGLITDQGRNVRGTRLAGAAARLMGSYQQGLLTLQKLRSGGRQEVHVFHQHVQVNEGGQAVVAGTLQTSRRGRRKNDG